jgi:hypothetical protein
MPFKPGQSGNPAGPRPGTKHRKDSALVLRILKDRNDTDPLALLSTIVTCAEAPLELRVQAAGMLAPYRHARCTTRYIKRKIKLPVVTTVEESTACIALISQLAAAGKLGLDEASDLVNMQRAFIESKTATDVERRVLEIEAALANANLNLGLRVEGGLPVPPGFEGVQMPDLKALAAPPPPPDDGPVLGGDGNGGSPP